MMHSIMVEKYIDYSTLDISPLCIGKKQKCMLCYNVFNEKIQLGFRVGI